MLHTAWRVRNCHGRHAIPSARWPVSPPVPSLCRPSPSHVPAASAVAPLTILKDQTLRSTGVVSKLDRRDHRAPDSASPAWKALRTTAAVTFTADVIASTPGRSSPIEDPCPAATKSPFSLPLLHYDMSDTEPAAFPVAPPTYVLFPMDGEVLMSMSPVLLGLVPPGFAPIRPPGSLATTPVSADTVPLDFAPPGSPSQVQLVLNKSSELQRTSSSSAAIHTCRRFVPGRVPPVA